MIRLSILYINLWCAFLSQKSLENANTNPIPNPKPKPLSLILKVTGGENRNFNIKHTIVLNYT